MKNIHYLRLVRNEDECFSTKLTPEKGTLLSLQSANYSNLEINHDLLMDALLGLNGLEQVHFSHLVRSTCVPDEKSNYGFEVRVKGSPQCRETDTLEFHQKLMQACPAFHFDEVHTNSEQSNLKSKSFARSWEIRSAPLVLQGRKTAIHNESYLDLDVSELPFPQDFADRTLNLDLIRSQVSGSDMQVSFQVRSFRIDVTLCHTLAKLKYRLDSGLVMGFHPDSLYQKDFASNGTLVEKASNLIDAWLRHPDRGLAWKLRVDCDTHLSHDQLKTIAKAAWGVRPVRIAPIIQDKTPQQDSWSLTDAVKPGQGLPSFLPEASFLRAAGIAEHFDSPAIAPPHEGGALIGTTVCGANSAPVALPEPDRLSHIGIFGASGSGKSTFLLRLLEQDLSNSAQPGIGLIDPHGSLYHDVLQIIPRHRAEDVVLVDVTDPCFISAINPLAGMAQDRQYANFISNEIVALIDVLFEGSDTTGPMMRLHIKNALMLASWMPGRTSSFLDASQLFEDKDFRDYLLCKCKDKKLLNYWRDFTATSGEHGFSNWLPYVQARLSPFCDSPLMRRMLNAPQSRIDLDKYVAQGKIVMFNLSSAALGSVESRIFGNLILNRIFYAAMRRKLNASMGSKPFHLVVDEAGSMVSASTMRLWAEARKFGLSITTANQSISQLRSRSGNNEIAQALLANTATKVFFRLSPSDAILLEPYAAPQFSAKELTRLPVFHCALSMSAYGQVLPAFVCKVQRPKTDLSTFASPQELSALSTDKYSSPITKAVEALVSTYDLPEDSFRTANDDPETTGQMALHLATGKVIEMKFPDQCERFVKLFEDALAFVMGSRWTMNMDDIQDKVEILRYYTTETGDIPDYQAVRARIEGDNTSTHLDREQIIKALEVMRPHFWLEIGSEAEEANA